MNKEINSEESDCQQEWKVVDFEDVKEVDVRVSRPRWKGEWIL